MRNAAGLCLRGVECSGKVMTRLTPDATGGNRRAPPRRNVVNRARGRSIRAASRQLSDADFLEPHDVAGVMILQADVARSRTLRFPFRLVPLLLGRHVRTAGIEARYPFPIELHNNSVALQRDEHR